MPMGSNMSLRGESNDRWEFDSTKQSVECKLKLKGLLRRKLLRFALQFPPRNDVVKLLMRYFTSFDEIHKYIFQRSLLRRHAFNDAAGGADGIHDAV